MTASKDSRAAHGAIGKKDVLQFDPEVIVLVEKGDDELSDERAHEDPSEAFIANLVEYGVIEPCIARKNTETGKTEIVDGRKRTLGLRAANKIRRTKNKDPWRLPVIIRRAAKGESIGVMISLNEMREPDSPLNLARKIAKAIEMNKTEAEVAIMCGKSIATVKNMLALLDAPAVVRNAVDAGKITASAGYKLARMEVGEAKAAVEKLVEAAPRMPGKKRATKKAAAAARAILDPGKTIDPTTTAPGAVPSTEAFGRRSDHQIENVLSEVMASPLLLPLAKSAVESFARWVLGSDEAIDELLRPGEKAAE